MKGIILRKPCTIRKHAPKVPSLFISFIQIRHNTRGNTYKALLILEQRATSGIRILKYCWHIFTRECCVLCQLLRWLNCCVLCQLLRYCVSIAVYCVNCCGVVSQLLCTVSTATVLCLNCCVLCQLLRCCVSIAVYCINCYGVSIVVYCGNCCGVSIAVYCVNCCGVSIAVIYCQLLRCLNCCVLCQLLRCCISIDVIYCQLLVNILNKCSTRMHRFKLQMLSEVSRCPFKKYKIPYSAMSLLWSMGTES